MSVKLWVVVCWGYLGAVAVGAADARVESRAAAVAALMKTMLKVDWVLKDWLTFEVVVKGLKMRNVGCFACSDGM